MYNLTDTHTGQVITIDPTAHSVQDVEATIGALFEEAPEDVLGTIADLATDLNGESIILPSAIDNADALGLALDWA